MNLLDLVQQHLGPNEIQQISGHLGTDSATTTNAIQAALPMIMGAMGQTAQQPSGANGILAALEQHGASGGSGGLLGALGSMSGMFSGASSTGNTGGVLGNLLGSHASTVQSGIQQASGLDAGKVERLLAILGPIVMTAIAQHQASAPAGNSGIGSILKQAAAAAQGSSSPQVSGVLGQILGRLQ
jgi:hypothetical protein